MKIGTVEVEALRDAEGSFATYAQAFPDVEPEAWAPDRERWPELFRGDRWYLPFSSYLVRAGESVVLVDTGVGTPGGGGFLPERQGRLPAELARNGLRPEEVGTVFLTHLHVDHVGWNGLFRHARFLVHRDALAYRALADAGKVEELTGDTEVAPGVLAVETPGHFPGHMSLRIGDDAWILGDVAVHPALLREPDRIYVSDIDREQAAATRRALLPELEGRTVACGHYPGTGIGRVSDGFWQEL